MSRRAEIFSGLRRQFLATRRADLAGEPVNARVYAMLFEVEANGTIVTLAASAAGDASVYLSTGGGAIGGIGVPQVREAAKALVAVAAELFERTAPDAEVPTPGRAEIGVALLTDDGLRALRMPLASRVPPGDPMVRLIRDANALTAMLLKAPAAKAAG